MPKINVYLSKQRSERLTELSSLLGVSRTQVIDQALEELVASLERAKGQQE